MIKRHLLILILILIACGCIQKEEKRALEVILDAPESIMRNQEFSAYLDIINNGSRTYRVKADFFDVGSFTKMSECSMREAEMRPTFQRTLECRLVYDKLDTNFYERIDAQVEYSSDFALVQSIEVLSQEEYKMRMLTGRLKDLPTTFSQKNEDIEIILEVSENPIVMRNVPHYAYVTIINIGNGFVDDLSRDKISITTIPSGYINCEIPNRLSAEKGIFPRISCMLSPNVAGEKYLNLFVIINIKYNYKIRKSAEIKIMP